MSDFDLLFRKIRDQHANVAVIGLGTVGLPLAMTIASKGYFVVGVDNDEGLISRLRSGYWPYEDSDPLAFQDAKLRRVLTSGAMAFSKDYTAIANSDVVIICVPTYISSGGEPNIAALDRAVAEAAVTRKRPVLIIIESTLPLGSTAHYNSTIIEEMRKEGSVFLAHCPERTTLGMLFHNLVHVPRIIGGVDEESSELAHQLYKAFTLARLYTTDVASAELTKVAENAYRFVQICFSNELALICQAHGLDAWHVLSLINTCPERTMLWPGPGVGGPCLLKDTIYYHNTHCQDTRPSLALAAIQLNLYMVQAVTNLVMETLGKAKNHMPDVPIAVVLGTAYREGVRDVRNSPANNIAQGLRISGLYVLTVDPVVDEDVDVVRMATGADVIVITTCHNEVRDLDWQQIGDAMNNRLIVDTRRCLYGSHVPEGFVIRHLGVG